jgi:TolB-like protein
MATMGKCTFLLTLFLLSAIAPADSFAATADNNGLIKMAILQFDSLNVESKDDNKGRMVSEFMTTAAVNMGVFDIVEREQLRKIVDEMEFGKNSQNYSSLAQKIGTLAGAEYVLSGSITAYKGSIRVDARLIKVSDGTIQAAYGSSCSNDLDSILANSKVIIEKVLEVIIPTASQMVLGQSAWAMPDAMIVDKDKKLWLEKRAAIRYEQNARFCMQITKNSQGFGVNTMKCDTKYKTTGSIDKQSLFPVTSLQY